MTWVLIIGVAWLAIAAVTALVVARAIRLADERERRRGDPTPVDDEGDHPRGDDDPACTWPVSPEMTVPQPRPADVDACRQRAAGPRNRRTEGRTTAPSERTRRL